MSNRPKFDSNPSKYFAVVREHITMQGPTLADAKGAKRIRKLEDSVLNLQMQVLEKLDGIAVMEHEIKELKKGGNDGSVHPL